MSEISRMFVHTIGVETHLGEGAGGDRFGARVNVKGFVSENKAIKLDGGSAELTSGDAGGESRVYTSLEHAEKFKPKSRVILPYRTAHVFKVRFQHGGTMGLPDHLEVLLV